MSMNRIVVKVGTSTLTDGTARLSMPRLVDLARQLSGLASLGHQAILVSSGAIAAGKEALAQPDLADLIPAKQMLAAIGQPRLMAMYEQVFHIYGQTVAQILLTQADVTDRRRYLNARDTLEALLARHVIPVINENDTVATEEIRFGDNDNLSALVVTLIEADLLVLLTDQAGLFTRDPRSDPSARLVPEIATPEIPAEIWQAAGGPQGRLGTGGMATKLQAADLARRSGTAVVIAQGSEPDVLTRLLSGLKLGTYLTPVGSRLESRKRYLLAGMRSTRTVTVDDGAAEALLRGGSLLPVGVRSVQGSFERGDTVRIVSWTGKEVAVGLVTYPARDLERLCGHQSSEIEALIGYTLGDEVVHRSNMVLL